MSGSCAEVHFRTVPSVLDVEASRFWSPAFYQPLLADLPLFSRTKSFAKRRAAQRRAARDAGRRLGGGPRSGPNWDLLPVFFFIDSSSLSVANISVALSKRLNPPLRVSCHTMRISLPPNTACGSRGRCPSRAARTASQLCWLAVSCPLLRGDDEPEILRSSSH